MPAAWTRPREPRNIGQRQPPRGLSFGSWNSRPSGRGGCQIACKQGDLPRPRLSGRPPTVGAPPSAGRTGKIRTMRAQEGGGWDGRRSATEAESPDRLGGMADSSLLSRRGNCNGDPVPKRGLGPNQGRSSGDSRWPPRNHNPGGPTRHEDPATALATGGPPVSRECPPSAGETYRSGYPWADRHGATSGQSRCRSSPAAAGRPTILARQTGISPCDGAMPGRKSRD